jgi:hypothetical protein
MLTPPIETHRKKNDENEKKPDRQYPAYLVINILYKLVFRKPESEGAVSKVSLVSSTLFQAFFGSMDLR